MQLQVASFPLWNEVVGVFHRVFADDTHLYVEIGNRLLSFSNESIESNIARKELCHELIGCKIGILLTDLPNEPIIVRIIKHNQSKVASSKCQSDEGKQAQSGNLANLLRGGNCSESK